MIQRTQGPRAGFTIIELLVVVAIIAIMVGLVAVGISSTTNRAKAENTRTLLKKLDKQLAMQYATSLKAAQAKAKTGVPPQIVSMAGGDAAVARAIYVKLLLKAEFPMSYAEAQSPSLVALSAPGYNPFPSFWTSANPPVPGIDTYVKAVQGKSGQSPAHESAALLVLMLKRYQFDVENALGPGALKDTDGDGLPEVVDGWGNPVYFCRWGTSDGNLDALNTSRSVGVPGRDKEDVESALMRTAWDNKAPLGIQDFQWLCHPIRNGTAAVSFYTEPVIVSGGKDGVLDLNPWLGAGPKAQDNIYGFKVR